jgi:nucleoside-diphosphate-sugar epimerase
MDFISIEDVCTVIEHYLENLSDKNLPRDVNLCYNKKMSLLDIATKINKIFGQKLENVIVENNNYDKEYTGSASVLDELDVSLLGLDYCLARCADVRES